MMPPPWMAAMVNGRGRRGCSLCVGVQLGIGGHGETETEAMCLSISY
jgi:hypothetical protein